MKANSLRGAANLADAALQQVAPRQGFKTEPWNDRHAVHAPVGRYRANAFGLHDTAGNVWEWCQGFYTKSYNEEPTGGTPREPTGASSRVFRGGAWDTTAARCRSARRTYAKESNLSNALGFRPARSCP